MINLEENQYHNFDQDLAKVTFSISSVSSCVLQFIPPTKWHSGNLIVRLFNKLAIDQLLKKKNSREGYLVYYHPEGVGGLLREGERVLLSGEIVVPADVEPGERCRERQQHGRGADEIPQVMQRVVRAIGSQVERRHVPLAARLVAAVVHPRTQLRQDKAGVLRNVAD